MALRRFHHLGFSFEVDPVVLQALVLTHLVGRDLRAADGLLERVFLDLLREAQARFGEVLARSGKGLRFRLAAAPDLRAKLAASMDEVRVVPHLLTGNAGLERLVRRSLPNETEPLEVLSGPKALRSAALGGLLLVDGQERSRSQFQSHLPNLDAMVHRTLVDASVYAGLDPSLKEGAIPVAAAGSQKPLFLGVAEALEVARFSKVFERCRASRLRWRTRWELAFQPVHCLVRAVLHFEGTERVLHATDLQRDIPWSQIPDLRFRDVLGLKAAKSQMQGHLDWLKDQRGEPGLRACVLSGPPGTGKTHLCLATAGEAGVPCLVMGGAEFLSQWYGETERIIRETFAALRQYDSAVLVIDEFEGLAWSRAQSNEWQAKDQASIVGELLRSVDRLRNGPGRVLLLATTNQYERLDAALVRSMRLDGRVHLGLPDAAERREVLAGLLPPEWPEADREESVGLTTGLNCADLARLVEAARKAAASPGAVFDLDALRRATFEARRGPVAPALQDSGLRRHIAGHEAGHALAAYHLLGRQAIEHVSIAPSTVGSLGAAYLRSPEDQVLVDRASVKHRLAVLLAGRAAEALLFPNDPPTCGFASDLQQATALATLAVSRWGMDEAFPLISLEGLPLELAARMGDRLLERVQAWLEEAQVCARETLACHGDALERLVVGLESSETLHRPEVLRLLEGPS